MPETLRSMQLSKPRQTLTGIVPHSISTPRVIATIVHVLGTFVKIYKRKTLDRVNKRVDKEIKITCSYVYSRHLDAKFTTDCCYIATNQHFGMVNFLAVRRVQIELQEKRFLPSP